MTIGQTSLRYFSLYLGNSVAKLLSSSRLDCCRAKRARTTTGARRNRGRVKSRHSSCSQASEHFPVTSSCESAAEIEQNAGLGGAAAGHHPQKGCPICRYVDGWCGTCCEKLLPLHPPLVYEALDTTPKLGTHPSPGVWLPPQQVNTIPNHQQASSTIVWLYVTAVQQPYRTIGSGLLCWLRVPILSVYAAHHIYSTEFDSDLVLPLALESCVAFQRKTSWPERQRDTTLLSMMAWGSQMVQAPLLCVGV